MDLGRFTLNYEVDEKRKVENFLKCYEGEIELDLKDVKIRRYWKIMGQFQAIFFVETDRITKEDRVYEILKLANVL